jgi:hypothetical protein
MREFLITSYPGVYLATQIVGVGSMIIFLIFSSFVIPFRVNRKLDPVLGPRSGEKWEFGKSPGYFAYYYIRATDYARAVISERYCLKKFRVSRETIRSYLNRSDVALCWIFKAAEYTFIATIAGVIMLGAALKLFGFT